MRIGKERIGVLLLVPSIVVFCTLILYPVGYSFWLSLQRASIISPIVKYVGIKNFEYLFHNPEFYSAAKFSFIWASLVVAFQMLIGLVTALVLNESFKGRSIVRGIILFPYLVPTVVGALTWSWMLNDTYGVINYLLRLLGIVREPVAWLSVPNYARFSVILVGIWKFCPFATVVLLARLTTIPEDLYDAAEIDGASVWQRFIYITLPHLKSIFLIVTIIRFIWMFNNFDVVYLMTRGGPGTTTMTLPILIYTKAFPGLRAGIGAALGIVMFLFLLIFSVLYFKTLYKEKEA